MSFAQLSLIRKKMSALTLSLPFSKIECAPDHHSLIKSALFFQSSFFSNFHFMSFKCWNWSLSFEAQNCCAVFFKDPKSGSVVYKSFLSSSKQKWTKCLELFNGRFLFALLSSSEVMLCYTDLDFGVLEYFTRNIRFWFEYLHWY